MNPTLLATALGDAHGLAVEGLSPRRQRRWYPHGLPVSGVLPGGRGLVSDDTEHAAMTAWAVARSAGDPRRFELELARGLKRWFWALPPATGWATARAAMRLSLGVPVEHSGCPSAGNGACMRAPILGALVISPGGLYDLVRRSSRMTHRDDRAIAGAFVLARWVQWAVQHRRAPNLDDLRAAVHPWLRHDEEWNNALLTLSRSVERGDTTPDFVAQQGWSQGPTGFVMHTVPAVLHTLASVGGDWEAVVRAAVALGGDADSVGALVGALAANDPRRGPLPAPWVDRLSDWPCSPAWLQAVEGAARQAMTDGRPVEPPPWGWGARSARNAAFLGVALAHGVRRALPPY